MAAVKTSKPKGLLNPKIGAQKFTLARYLPAPDLAFFVEHYWIVRWDLRGQDPYVSETLPKPSVQAVFEPDGAHLYGVIRGKFARRLSGLGRVLGIQFRPGAFYPFVKTPVSGFTDKVFELEAIFGAYDPALNDAILGLEDDQEQVELAETFLRARLPERDDNVEAVNRIIDHITADRTILKVDDVVGQLGIHKRALQRLFQQYVGISPKWVIQRCRLHEAAEQLAAGEADDGARMALELGYFDQAHFINDFKTFVGRSPVEYARGLEMG